LSPADGGDRVVQALQDDRVLYSNQPVAVAIADTFERALHAAGLVRVRVEPAPFTVRIEDELHAAFPYGARGQPADHQRGDVEAALRRAEHKLEAEYETPPEIHSPLEPHATLAVWNGDRLTVYDATQASSESARSWPARLPSHPAMCG